MKRYMTVFVVAAFVLGACSSSSDNKKAAESSTTGSGSGTTTTATASQSSSGPVITIKNLAFGGVTKVAAGTTVTVRNEDSVRHTFHPDNAGAFQAAEINPGDSFEVTFFEAGTFGYHCNIHTTMKGTIEVTA